MGTSFKDLSFFKKLLGIFLICMGVIIIGCFGLFLLSSVGNYFGPSMSTSGMESSDAMLSSSDSYSNSKSSNSSSSSADTMMAKDFSASIESKDIVKTVDSVRELSQSYDAILEGSSAGDSGYGYIDFKVPSDKASAFLNAIRKQFNVTDYTEGSVNVADDMKYNADRLDFLKEELKTCEDSLKSDVESGFDGSYWQERISEIREEIWYLENSQNDIVDDVVYSTVSVYVTDSSYTPFHAFDGVWLAIKNSVHFFVLAVVYGFFIFVYIILVLFAIRWITNMFKKIEKRKSQRRLNNLMATGNEVTVSDNDSVSVKSEE